MTNYVLAFYEINRVCGGPEEGGWWYDTGQIVRVWRTFKTKEKAFAVAHRANRLLERLQQHRPDVRSVVYAGGRYSVSVYEDFAPKFYPETRPRYE
ncbi:hypothetical protein ACFFTN_13175 [Aminobacter aganoensis]|uniref:Uncharacterized protein n=1 Tax=Aminobacter aganoensis TaxID=83264 RepID=A0A7X0KM40_9HYPH|nr:hypothetical protein [Aminobacter aganoensis]MBB6355737.1 hypothetical protein [Aminobacter aganoensis]